MDGLINLCVQERKNRVTLSVYASLCVYWLAVDAVCMDTKDLQQQSSLKQIETCLVPVSESTR